MTGPAPGGDRPRLLLDDMLGTLSRYLRMCGYDAAYPLAEGDGDRTPDDELLALARAEGRRVLTRDRQLAARAADALLLTARDVEAQLAELDAAGFELRLPDEPVRCGTCNARLDAVAPDEPTPEYAPDPATTPVWRCPACGQHFWKGSHWADVRETLSEIR